MKNPAREKFLPMLSPYVDGELSPEERQLLEQHLSNNKDSAGQVADFRAADALMRHALEMQADAVDWKAFTDDVMSKVTPEKLPLFERLKLTLSEMFTYQRGPLIAGLAGAAAALAIAVPVSLKFSTPDGYGATKMQVQTVSADENQPFKPVVMETESGDAIIWVVESAPDAGKKKKDGEDSEETLSDEPAATPDGKQGDL
jgi:anti-sigma factor RsiW